MTLDELPLWCITEEAAAPFFAGENWAVPLIRAPFFCALMKFPSFSLFSTGEGMAGRGMRRHDSFVNFDEMDEDMTDDKWAEVGFRPCAPCV